MSVILVDLGDDQHDIKVATGWWCDTVAIMRPLGVLGEERLQRLETYWLGQELTQDDARAVGEAIVAGPLSRVIWSDNVYPPDGYWMGYRSHSWNYDLDTYWLSWLRAFAGFCQTCKGFVIY
jgi:hypothetical protein